MAKKTQSIDGFALKRRDGAPLDAAVQHIFLDSMQSPTSTAKSSEAAAGLQRVEADYGQNVLSADVTESLQNLGTEQAPEPNLDKKARRLKIKKPKLSRKEKHELRREKRRRHPIRRIIKWFFITTAVLLLAMIGWLTFKALMTGSQLFQGNIMDIFTSKARLNEDQNGRTNILIFGTSGYAMKEDGWDGAFLTDSIMVISVDQDKHDAYMISLPRDLYVRHTCKKLLGTTAGKLNETYYCAYIDNNKNEEKGAAALRKTAGQITGLDIQYYVHVDWTALIKAVDAVGGVDVTVQSVDKRGIYDRMTGLKLPNGTVHLDGETALAFSRARNSEGGYGLPGGNFDREKNQQKVLTALQQKALSAGTLANPAAINSLLDAMGDNLRTNFKTSEVQSLLDLAKNLREHNMISLPLVDRPDGAPDLMTTGMLGAISIVRPVKDLYDYSDIVSYIAKSISSDPVVREAAKIDVLNGSAQAGLAQDKADELKKAGYQIDKVTNAPSTIADKVKIYQLTTGKTATATALEKRFGVKIVDGKPDGYNSKADFVIIFGIAATE